MPDAWRCCSSSLTCRMPEAAARCRVAVVGGGAAGLMAAITAAQTWQDNVGAQRPESGRVPVLLIEKMDRVGKKLLTTGNGRCNLSNLNLSIDHYHGQDPSFAAGVLAQYTVSQTIGLFRCLGLLCRQEEDRIYPYSLQASAVLDILRLAAERLGVMMATGHAVRTLAHAGRQTGYRLTVDDGRVILADRVIIATGGLAAPGLGCDGSGYELMTAFGHRRTAVFPGLVQVRTVTGLVQGLAGIKTEGTATVKVGRKKIRTAQGEILFTAYGLSGPPLLDLSRHVTMALQDDPDATVDIVLDLLPGLSFEELTGWLAERRRIDENLALSEYLTGLVNKKLGQAILKQCLGQKLTLAAPASALNSQDLSRLAGLLKALTIRAVGTRDWTQAQVTAGGLETAGFNPNTLESRLAEGLYAAGEILDIDGDCGGFNLQWAWSSGQAAGRDAMLKSLSGARP